MRTPLADVGFQGLPHALQAACQRRRLRGAEGDGALACRLERGGARGGGCELLAGRHCPEWGAVPGGSGSAHPTLRASLAPGGGLAEHELPGRRAPSQRGETSRAHLLLTEPFASQSVCFGQDKSLNCLSLPPLEARQSIKDADICSKASRPSCRDLLRRHGSRKRAFKPAGLQAWEAADGARAARGVCRPGHRLPGGARPGRAPLGRWVRLGVTTRRLSWLHL